jgi:hypothetical protein
MFPLRTLFCFLAIAYSALVCSATEHILFLRLGPTPAA